MTRIVRWFDTVLWWLDERRETREHHLTHSKKRPRAGWTAGGMTHRGDISNEHHTV